ncbi:MAG TPA: magnesium transporter [Rhizomicrobium sp.]|jgi:magnesium transporter|nr:magnesium transporter [Rhizomicrobium sp.]
MEEITPRALAAAHLKDERPADIVEALNALDLEEALEIVTQLPLEVAVAVFDTPGLEAAPEYFVQLPLALAAQLLSLMSTDRAAEIIRGQTAEFRHTLLAAVAPDARAALNRVLKYPEYTAGSIMTTEFVTARSDWTVAETLEHVRRVERSRETVYAIYVMDVKTKQLVNAVTLRRLIAGEDDAPVLSVASEGKPVSVPPLMDREEVARIISKYDLLAVPVVERGKVLGIVTVDDIIDAILEETTEDVQRFGGVGPIDEPYMQIGLLQMIRKRAGWLSVLFLSEMLTASAMQHFDDELQRAIVLTLFIPLIMSSGGNSGSQATSLLIRALALGEVRLSDWWRIALRELPIGLALGAILGVVGVLRITIWQFAGFYDYGPHWVLVATTVAAALVGIVTFGSLSGSMLPFALKRVGFDPASASAPFVATLVDVTGLVIYFTVALAILRGTLL